MSKTTQDSPEVAAAKARREEDAAKLYASSRSKEPERHAELERRYNESNRELASMQGTKDPGYQKDVREDYKFSTEKRQAADGQTIQVRTAEGPNHDPDQVINWRKTDVGGKADRNALKNVREAKGATHDGDDGGHLIATEKGVDPAAEENIGMQNRPQNQTGTWRAAEREANDHAKEHPGGRLQVQEQYAEKYGDNRAIKRTSTVTDKNGKQVNASNVEFGNFPHVPNSDSRAQTLKVQANHPNAGKFHEHKKNRREESIPASAKKTADIPQAANDNAPSQDGPKPTKPDKAKNRRSKSGPKNAL